MDEYLKVVREKGTFKLTLWENVPEFREICQNEGVQLEKFWNLSDPDQVAAAIKFIQDSRSSIFEQFLQPAINRRTGLSLDQLTPEIAKVLADEVLQATLEARDKIVTSIGNSESQASIRSDADRSIENLREVAERAISLTNPKARKDMSAQVANFLSENGIDVSDTSPQYLVTLLNDEAVISTIRHSYRSKIIQKQAAVQLLTDKFGHLKPTDDSTLASRSEDDLYLGDLTGDCTAYHLNVGMNAWTVPVWLSDPGFVMFKKGEGAGLTTKMGLLLAISNQGPAIIIDSLEVGKNITDENEARSKIREGLREVREWAERIGIKKVLISNITNSSELVSDLEGVSGPSDLRSLQVLGGLAGVAELRRNLLGATAQEKIYIQTEQSEENRPALERQLKRGITYSIEELINKAIRRANPEDKEVISNLAKNIETTKLMSIVIAKNFPALAKVKGSELDNYRPLLDQLKCNEEFEVEGENGESVGEILDYFVSKDFIDEDSPDILTEEKLTPRDQLLIKATDRPVIEFFTNLKILERLDYSLDDVLRTLYKSARVDNGDIIRLDPKIPELTI